MWNHVSYWFWIVGSFVALASAVVWFMATRLSGDDDRSKFIGHIAGWLALVGLAFCVVSGLVKTVVMLVLLIAVIAGATFWYDHLQHP